MQSLQGKPAKSFWHILILFVVVLHTHFCKLVYLFTFSLVLKITLKCLNSQTELDLFHIKFDVRRFWWCSSQCIIHFSIKCLFLDYFSTNYEGYTLHMLWRELNPSLISFILFDLNNLYYISLKFLTDVKSNQHQISLISIIDWNNPSWLDTSSNSQETETWDL